MRAFGFWVLIFMVLAALMCFSFSTKGGNFSTADVAFAHSEYDKTIVATNRKLKGGGHTPSTEAAGHVNLEDYGPFDPSPNSKASVRPGPIEHGTPLMPYIPKPSPPSRPRHGGYP